MPNWCNNLLLLSGSPAAIADFQEKFESRAVIVDPDEPARLPRKVGLLNAFVPIPLELVNRPAMAPGAGSSDEQLIAKYGARDWYEWCNKNWGTKWDVMEDGVGFDEEGDCLIASFESAWAPPIAGILAISELFPDVQLDLRYEEPGCDFEGQFVALNGKVLCNEEQAFSEGELLDPDHEDSDRECIPLEHKFGPFEFHH
jgi:hypothetical protein